MLNHMIYLYRFYQIYCTIENTPICVIIYMLNHVQYSIIYNNAI